MKITQKELAEIRQSTRNDVRIHLKHYDGVNGGGCRARLWHTDGRVIAHATGCGYDRAGTAFGDCLALLYPAELQALAESDVHTIKKVSTGRDGSYYEKDDHKYYGLRLIDLGDDVCQFSIDGGCGMRSMETIAEALGFTVEHYNTGKLTSMIVLKRVNRV